MFQPTLISSCFDDQRTGMGTPCVSTMLQPGSLLFWELVYKGYYHFCDTNRAAENFKEGFADSDFVYIRCLKFCSYEGFWSLLLILCCHFSDAL